MQGLNFEREIREQPGVWRRLAASDKAPRLAQALRERSLVLLGTGSSLFVAQLGALAFRRRGINAHALSATEVLLDNACYRHTTAIAVSQSGASADLLRALDVVQPAQLIALTNVVDSPLGHRADLCIDVGAGPEVAVPASKSVTASAAILLWAAGLSSGETPRSAQTLLQTAGEVEAWLNGPAAGQVSDAAKRISRRRSVIVVSTGYGLPIAHEFALKWKEASYIHAEGFSAGEFRHGSTAMLDAACALVGIVDEASYEIVGRVLEDAAESEVLRYVVGYPIDGVPLVGPLVPPAFNTLAWLVTGQMLALYTGRARFVESDTPRGLTKAIV
jgi:glucosamine--fructose-6-phosphate aminotransferase (isomerizing)